MRFVNTGTPTHRNKDPARCLHEAEREKKRMYLDLGGWTGGGGGDGNPEKVTL